MTLGNGTIQHDRDPEIGTHSEYSLRNNTVTKSVSFCLKILPSGTTFTSGKMQLRMVQTASELNK